MVTYNSATPRTPMVFHRVKGEKGATGMMILRNPEIALSLELSVPISTWMWQSRTHC